MKSITIIIDGIRYQIKPDKAVKESIKQIITNKTKVTKKKYVSTDLGGTVLMPITGIYK